MMEQETDGLTVSENMEGRGIRSRNKNTKEVRLKRSNKKWVSLKIIKA